MCNKIKSAIFTTKDEKMLGLCGKTGSKIYSWGALVNSIYFFNYSNETKFTRDELKIYTLYTYIFADGNPEAVLGISLQESYKINIWIGIIEYQFLGQVFSKHARYF